MGCLVCVLFPPRLCCACPRYIVVHLFKADSCPKGNFYVFVFYLFVFQLFIIIILCCGKFTIHSFQLAKIVFFLIWRIFF